MAERHPQLEQVPPESLDLPSKRVPAVAVKAGTDGVDVEIPSLASLLGVGGGGGVTLPIRFLRWAR